MASIISVVVTMMLMTLFYLNSETRKTTMTMKEGKERKTSGGEENAHMDGENQHMAANYYLWLMRGMA